MTLKTQNLCGRAAALLLVLLFLPIPTAAEPKLCPAVSPAADENLKAYLVSRSLTSVPGLASHRFIAIARYPADPNADIISFSHYRGMAVRDYGSAWFKDWRAWRRLGPKMPRSRRLLRGVNAAVIPAPVWRVRYYVDTLVEDLTYKVFGPNSNTLAQAIANMASGTNVKVFENRIFGSPGRRQWRRVNFRQPMEPMILLAVNRSAPLCPMRRDFLAETPRIATSSVSTPR